jgi:hypothetical protein
MKLWGFTGEFLIQSCHSCKSGLKFINCTALICGVSAKPNASPYCFARQQSTEELNNELTTTRVNTNSYQLFVDFELARTSYMKFFGIWVYNRVYLRFLSYIIMFA